MLGSKAFDPMMLTDLYFLHCNDKVRKLKYNTKMKKMEQKNDFFGFKWN